MFYKTSHILFRFNGVLDDFVVCVCMALICTLRFSICLVAVVSRIYCWRKQTGIFSAGKDQWRPCRSIISRADPSSFWVTPN